MAAQTTHEALATAREALRMAQEAVRIAEEAADISRADAGRPAPVWDEITVKKINLVEDDGRLRMIIGNSTHGKVVPMRGEMRSHPGRSATAGLLFINDDGIECGGLQFSGSPASDEEPARQTGYMTFDDFEQNESFRIGLSQEGTTSERFIEFTDQPSWSLVDFLDEYEAAATGQDRAEVRERYFAGRPGIGASRLLLCRDGEGNACIILRDGQGRDRLRFVVPSDGEPRAEVVGIDGAARSIIPVHP